MYYSTICRVPDNEELESFKPLESREKVHITISISISYKQRKRYGNAKTFNQRNHVEKVMIVKKN